MANNIHIGEIIKCQIHASGMTKSEFSRRLNTSPQNAYEIVKRSSINTEMLQSICKILNYDFFAHYQEGRDSKDNTSLERILEEIKALKEMHAPARSRRKDRALPNPEPPALQQSIQVLKEHQAWRKGLVDEMPCTPKALSEAIEIIVSYQEQTPIRSIKIL
jgi:plasmid maintenance system antidote protein VapI